MTNLMERADNIRDRLTQHFLETGAAVSPMPIEDWFIAAGDIGPHARFGFGWPWPWENPRFIVPFCPEILADVTSELNDDDLDEFLGALEFLGDSQLGHLCDGETPERAYELAEDELWATGPGSMVLLNNTQASVLDRGIAC